MMALSVEIVQGMLDYHYATQRRVWESIMTLTDEQFVADIPFSHGSIRNQMVHLASTDGGWLRGLQGVPNARSFGYAAEEHTTRESVRLLCDRSAEEVTTFASELSEADLKQTPQGMPLPIWQTLLHLVNHGTDHRAQVLRALHALGATTFDQDLAFYWMGR
jgi:uncharacterized damage-inducible protein DinB